MDKSTILIRTTALICFLIFSQLKVYATALVTQPDSWVIYEFGYDPILGATPTDSCSTLESLLEETDTSYELDEEDDPVNCPGGGTVDPIHEGTYVGNGQCSMYWAVNYCGDTSVYQDHTSIHDVSAICPEGYSYDSEVGSCLSDESPVSQDEPNWEDIPPELGVPKECAPPGNPINPANGNKLQVELDYLNGTKYSLPIMRTYNSLADSVVNEQLEPMLVGKRWHHSLDLQATIFYSDRIIEEELVPTLTRVILIRGDGNRLVFSLPEDESTGEIEWGNSLVGLQNRLEKVEVSSEGDSLEYRRSDGALETYELTTSNGNITWMSISEITNIDGSTSEFTYDGSDRLVSVTQTPGADYSISYDSNFQIREITVPGGTIAYSYDANSNLESVEYPDTSIRTYVYEDSTFPNALTGIIDENNKRLSTYAYDIQERGILTKQAGDTNLYTFSYNEGLETEVTDPFNNTITYQHTNVLGQLYRSYISELSETCSSKTTSKMYDYDTGRLTYTEDGNYNGSSYSYDNEGKTITVTNSLSESTVYEYLDSAQLETYTKGDRKISFVYNSNFQVTSKSVTDLNTSEIQEWTYTYDSNNRLQSVNDPRTDVNDTYTFSYYSSGDLQTITNPLFQVTTYSNYTPDGRVGKIVDPNGIETTFTYTSRGWLDIVTRAGLTTDFDYDSVGNVTKVTLPDSTQVEYTYDDAHRLTRVTDYEGNYIQYTLDAVGNRTEIKHYDSSNVLVFEISQTFNNFGRRSSTVGSLNQTVEFGYDDNGNITNVTDGLGNEFSYYYDALNRIESESNDTLAIDSYYTYNAHGDISTVDDFNYNQTVFTKNGLLQLTELDSPDSGLTYFTYDSVSNLTAKTDAESRTLQYTYDALNRITKVEGTSYDVVFGYDEETNSIGQLGSIDDNWGFTKFLFNSQGLLAEKSQTPTGGTTLTAEYNYSSSGELDEIEYPSGATVSYVRGANGKVGSIKINNVTHISNIEYQPFGDVLEWDAANSVSYTRTYNQDGYIGSITYPDTTRVYSYDENFNVTEIEDTNYSSKTQSMEYDGGNRLASYTRNSVTTEWEYDGNGNRIIENTGAVLRSFYTSGNQISEIYRDDLYETETSFAYDATGNLISRNSVSYIYDEASRLIQIIDTSSSTVIADYVYNGMGQRVQKTVNGQSTHYFYDEVGHLLGEYSGVLSTEYVWLGESPVAIIVDNGTTTTVYYVHPDHLNAPRYLTDSSGTIVWNWDGDAFGQGLADEDPDSNSQDVVMNLRFPGQQFDKETGLHYNYFRDYDPSLGRYLQSDPIGLAGGLNTYGYVLQNPLKYIDPLGLDWNPADYPDPNGVVPGGPWEPNMNDRPGSYMGPKPDKGPRNQCQYVPETATSGDDPYWKTKDPKQDGWQRYDTKGNPITPEQAHGYDKKKKGFRPKGDPRNPFTPSPDRLPPGHPLEDLL